MIRLSDNLSRYVRNVLKINDNKVNMFSEEQLSKITSISISRDDVSVVKYFKNLVHLDFNSYPSLTSEDVLFIGCELPNISSIKIKEQNSIYRLDLSSYKNLKEVAIIHNENLVDFCGIDNVYRFTFYDNKEYKNNKQLVDYLDKHPESIVTLDFLYYIHVYRNIKNKSIFEKIRWVESTGLRNFNVHQFTKDEIESVIGYIGDIASKFTYPSDDPIEKFTILYQWMITNIKFYNADDPTVEENIDMNNSYTVFNYGSGGRVSYAKAFQMLLTYVDVDATIVNSYGALDSIGYYNGKKVFSLFGTSDYSLLRLTIDGRNYYCDVAWDSMIKNFQYFDVLRLFLISKDELSLRHRLVGEGNVLNSYSYHGDDSDELVFFAQKRVEEVNKFFDHLNEVDKKIKGIEINKLVNVSGINKATSREEISEINKDLINDLGEYNSWVKGRNNIIRRNAKMLRNNYLVNHDLKGDKLYNYLIDQLENMRISKYLFDILINL